MGSVKCTLCQKSFRAGSMVVLERAGKLVRARVCKPCASQAHPMLFRSAGEPCACGGRATKCDHCVETALEGARRKTVDAKALALAIRKRSGAYGAPDEFTAGLKEGLEQAANFLEKGGWAKS